MGFELKHNELVAARRRVPMYALSDSDGTTPITNLTISAGDMKITKANGAPANHLGTLTTINAANGLYYYTCEVTEVDTLGPLGMIIDKTDVRDIAWESQVVSHDPIGEIVQNQSDSTKRNMLVYLVNNTDAVTPITGMTGSNMTIKLSKNGAALVAAAGTITELSIGLYNYVATQSEVDSEGFFILSILPVTPDAFRNVARFSLITAAVGEPEGPGTGIKYRIPIVPDTFLRAAHTKSPKSGPPKYAAVWPNQKRGLLDDDINPEVTVAGQDPGLSRQEWKIQFYPTPDIDYVLEYRYERRPGVVDLTTPFPEGAGLLAEVILASGLSIVEQRTEKAAGVETERFLALLEQAKARDANAELPTAGSIWPNDLEGFDKHATSSGVRSPGTSSAPGFNYRVLRRDVGHELGVGDAPQSWTHREDRMVDRCIQSGYRKMLMPRLIEGLKRKIHGWTFLEPKATLLLGAADTGKPDQRAGSENLYNTPLNYRELVGDMFLESPISGHNVIRRISTQKMQDLLTSRTGTNTTNRPQTVAVRYIVTDTLTYDENALPVQVQNSLAVFEFFPTPDTDYTVTYIYSLDPFPLTNDNVVPFGAPIHSETLRSLCLAEAEVEIHKKRGVRFEEAMECLEKSILFDSGTKGRYHGYAGDNSDRVHSDPHGHHFHNAGVTYEGVQY